MNRTLRALVMASTINAAFAISFVVIGNAGPAAGAETVVVQAEIQEQPAPETDTFGRSQFILSGNPIIPPRDYGKGLQLPDTNDYSPDESGTIYDIAFLGIENGEMQFEIRGYSIADLNSPATGQTSSFPQDQKTIEIRDIVIEIEEVTDGSLTYKIVYRK
ncbi:hypothetical protein J3U99_09990 [Brucella pituitosa]|uniref:hypothetical protein n=1 Tax=Brucella pituitosa TaxID=571256 RepID=UPI00200666D3|nr:hypothetical protein [Brucella pituitosa]MCK4205096.1 hypothetical protein [Brucella pituitosa]